MTKNRNRYISSICQRLGERDHLRALQRFVGEYRRAGDALEQVAIALGVTAVVREKLPFDGGVFPGKDGLIIKINSLSNLKRQRFTLAHELAHLILEPKKASSARRCVLSSDLERACDGVAAELLMPLEDVKSSAPREGSIEALLALSDRFHASLYATAIRVKEVAGWSESIGLWKWNGIGKELWFVGKRYWSERQVSLNAFELAMKTSGTLNNTEELREREKGVYFEVRRLGKDHLLGLLRA